MWKSPKITIVLLNYRRPKNIPLILKSIEEQTIKANIFLWNNGERDVDSPLLDRYVQSDKNVGCMVRWRLAREADTPYVMSLDDDICFSRDNALEDIIGAIESTDKPNRIIGICGGCFGKIPYYGLREDYECPLPPHMLSQDVAVDVIKGRMMAFRSKLLVDLDLPEEREDDIYLSSVFANRARRFHRIPVILNDAFKDLPTYGEGNWFATEHFLSRDRALREYFSPGGFLDGRFVRYLAMAPYRMKLLALRRLGRVN